MWDEGNRGNAFYKCTSVATSALGYVIISALLCYHSLPIINNLSFYIKGNKPWIVYVGISQLIQSIQSNDNSSSRQRPAHESRRWDLHHEHLS